MLKQKSFICSLRTIRRLPFRDHLSHIISSEGGFALPSILMLVTILSLFSATVLSFQYFDRLIAIREVSKVKAEYASESGIATALGESGTHQGLQQLLMKSQRFQFVDNSESSVTLQPWGIFFLIRSEGKCGKSRASRTALVAEHLSSMYDNALCFANSSHQLVFTGQSSVKGNVIVGQPGVTIGNLHDYSTPIHIPIEGMIERQSNPEMPMFETTYLYGEIRKCNTLLEQAARADGKISSTVGSLKSNTNSLSGMSKDSTSTVLLNGNLIIEDTIARQELPLSIAATGSITLKRNTILNGLILVTSTNQIVIEEGAVLDHVICYSERSIEVQDGSTLSAQLIAPVIRVGKECMLKYPSVLLSTDINSPDTSHQDISISSGSRIEGTFALLSSSSTPDQGLNRRIIDLKAGASVTGSVYSQGTVTLDGIVTGMVQAKDFYFYAAPTSYLGWLRSARIDRSGLPKSYLLPPGFSASPKLDVLDWL